MLGGEHGLLQFKSIDLGKEKLKSQRENLKVIALFRLLDLQFSENTDKFVLERFYPFKKKQNKRNNFQVANK